MKAIILLILITSGSALAQNIRNMAPCWSPNGQRIAYYSNRDGNNEIYILNLNNGDNIRITNNHRSDVLPKFSPNGLRLVFFSGEKGAHQISVINLQDNSETLLTGIEANHEDPNWINDSLIIYNSDKSGNFEIYSQHINNRSEKRLTNDSLRDFTPDVSPDRSKVIFVRGELGKETALYTMNLDGSDQQKLSLIKNAYTPVWSPNGKQIFYMHRGSESNDIYVWSAELNVVNQITNDQANDIFPAVSPNGKNLAFSSTRDTGSYEIYIMDMTSKEIKRLTFDSKQE